MVVNENICIIYDAAIHKTMMFHFKPGTSQRICSRTFRISSATGHAVRWDHLNRCKSFMHMWDKVFTVENGYVVHPDIGIHLFKCPKKEREIIPSWVWRLEKMWDALMQPVAWVDSEICFLCTRELGVGSACTSYAICCRTSHDRCVALSLDCPEWQTCLKFNADKFAPKRLFQFVPYQRDSVCGLCAAGIGI